jgi:oleandomycin transport system ATP-binding protein
MLREFEECRVADHGLETQGLAKRFGRRTALDGVDLVLSQGQILGLLGPNGAGKTTLIRILATLLRPDAGTARVAGYDVTRHPAEVRRRIALSGQHTSVDEELGGKANLVMIGQLLDLTRRDAAHRADELLSRFGLTDDGDRRVATYSGGMRRRLDLAASLVGRPQVVFLDEPSAGLDPGKRDELWRMIRDLSNDGVTVLLTTQYLEEADVLADVITVIDQGRVAAAGTPAELKQQLGGHTVTVRVNDPADADRAAAVLTAVTGRTPERPTRQQLAVPVTRDDDFYRITAQLRHQSVDISELSLRLPSLDEVFLALTRTPARPPTKAVTP